MKIVASGKTGTIGKHLPEYVVDLNQRLDQLDAGKINLSKNDTYIHLAGVVGSQNVDANPEYARRINVDSVAKVAEIALQKNVNKFVYISTSHVYSKGEQDKSENSPIDPVNEYAAQKFESEEILRSLFASDPKKLLILRVFSILDWDVKEFTLGGAIQRLRTDPTSQLRFGGDLRDFLTPKQTADVILELSNLQSASQLLNVCTGEAISISEAAVLLLNGYEKRNWEERVDNEVSENSRIVGNADLVSEALGRKLRWHYKDSQKLTS